MKKFLATAFVSALSMPMLALAHGDKIEMNNASVVEATKDFKADHPDQVAGFQGTKSWFEGDAVKVRIYLPNNVTMLYKCMHHDSENGEEVLQCHMEM